MADKLNIYSKDNLKTPIATGDDTTGAKVTGLAAGTKVNDGDFVATHVDQDGKHTESPTSPVPGWTVNPAKS
ncbi:hypothetical protein [Lentilactobacillus buchneri]|uniref:hypothetical protein n=1 Tax=Lentilactobacillus buchneri TaxID=1581 RepID=UPI0021A934A0|nr:hypothetical protein [Lentilactobacillus buchneri]MCT2881925.1 hypothetical protein [Lentilactobacillus buchneri]